ncbi:MAG TPA: hypothetical protein VER58_04020 [Thermoanaerobaculia bacterium]|nr:hypothetical protein [Thermoanaerobaculia bacterium]
MSGRRLIVGAIAMGIIVPACLFFLLDLQTVSQVFTIAAVAFLTWGSADLLASILERPRLTNRTPGGAIREDLERRQG